MASVKSGSYSARVSGEVVLGSSKEKKTPFVEFLFRIKGGEFDGRSVRWTGYFTDKTNERTIQALETCGWKGEDLSVFADGGLHGLDNNEVEIVVESEEFTNAQGETKSSARVAWINRIGFLNTEAAMSSDAASAFGAKMNGIVAAIRSRKPLRTENSTSPVNSDDIPF